MKILEVGAQARTSCPTSKFNVGLLRSRGSEEIIQVRRLAYVRPAAHAAGAVRAVGARTDENCIR